MGLVLDGLFLRRRGGGGGGGGGRYYVPLSGLFRDRGPFLAGSSIYAMSNKYLSLTCDCLPCPRTIIFFVGHLIEVKL